MSLIEVKQISEEGVLLKCKSYTEGEISWTEKPQANQ